MTTLSPSAAPQPVVDPGWSVNHIIARLPVSMQVLNACGIDTCCGGELSLRDAATDASVDIDEVLGMLDTLAREER